MHSPYMRRLLEAPTIVHALKAEAALTKRARLRHQAVSVSSATAAAAQ